MDSGLDYAPAMEKYRAYRWKLMGKFGELVANESRRSFSFGYCFGSFPRNPYRIKFMACFEQS